MQLKSFKYSVLCFAGLAIYFSANNLYARSGSPLDEYPGFGHNPEADIRKDIRAYDKRERNVQRCMRDARFQYETRELVIADDLNESDLAASVNESPNMAYYHSLNVVEREAYNLAMYGIPHEPREGDDVNYPTVGSGGGGCFQAAERDHKRENNAVKTLRKEYRELRKQIRNDSRFANVVSEWSECLADRGLPNITDPSDLERKINEAWNAVVKEKRIVEGESMTENQQAVAAQQRRWRGISNGCKNQVRLPRRLEDIQIEYETRFVEEHRDTLDTILP